MFIVITGPSASGKSVFAARLSRELGIPFFTKDRLKIALSEHVKPDDPDEARLVLSHATGGALFCIAESLLDAGVPFILEANFRQYECDRINAMVASRGCKCLAYLFAGDLHALAKRFIEREKTAERHESLRLPGFVPDHELYARQFEEFVDIRLDTEVVKVDATGFESIDFDGLVSTAREFLRGGVECRS
ncbi:MAG: ATP-binding protein [Defluviitaleaceae bacterium]|nr:ATP-binding protein [Defluviitaleaceae bacterium]